MQDFLLCSVNYKTQPFQGFYPCIRPNFVGKVEYQANIVYNFLVTVTAIEIRSASDEFKIFC